MWGADFQNSNPYDGFVSGYSHTLRDDVTINQLTTNTDGTVTANITIVALEDTNAGQVTSTYQGTYILGQENGTWKFLRVWNGDQTDWGLNFTSVPQVLRVRLATY